MYVVLNFSGAAETIIIAGLAAFAPKVLEEKFNMLPAESGLIMGKFVVNNQMLPDRQIITLTKNWNFFTDKYSFKQ